MCLIIGIHGDIIHATTLPKDNNQVVVTKQRHKDSDVISINAIKKRLKSVYIKGIENNQIIFEKYQNSTTNHADIILTKQDVIIFNGQLIIEVAYSDNSIETIVKDNVVIDNVPPNLTHKVPKFIKDIWKGELIIEDEATSGLVKQYQLIVNGHIIEQKNNINAKKIAVPLHIDTQKKTVNRVPISFNNELELYSRVVDNSGNSKLIHINNVFIDKTSPTVKTLALKSGEKDIQTSDAQFTPTLFTNQDITLIATVSDNTPDGSGVDSAIIVLRDSTTNQTLFYVNQTWQPLVDIREAFDKGAINVKEQTIEQTLVLPSQVNGKLSLIVKDKVGNISALDKMSTIEVVFESKSNHQHNGNLNVLIDEPTAHINNTPLYNQTPSAVVTVQEMFSNVETIEWDIVQKNEIIKSNSINIGEILNKDRQLENISIVQNDKGMTVTLNAIQLIGEDNHTTLHVKTINQTGNSREYRYSYIVDETPPKISIKQNILKKYVNEPVVIDVEISDKHLNKDKIMLTGSLQQAVQSVMWYRHGESLYGQFVVQHDGEHVWGLVIDDVVGNRTVYNGDPFVIDRIPPVMTVKTAGENKGIFYRTAVMYQLHVSDEHLDDVIIHIKKDDELLPAIKVKPFHNSHTMQFYENGEYTINISVRDLANNIISWHDNFIIDTKIDEFNLIGVLDGQFYKWGPTVTFRGRDKHIDYKTTTVFYIEKDGSQNKVWYKREDTNTPMTYELQHILNNEGYYRIANYIVDKAGNEQQSEQTILFSRSPITFEPNKSLEKLIEQQVISKVLNSDRLELSLLSWIPFNYTQLVLVKDSKIIPISYDKIVNKALFQKEKHRFIIPSYQFEHDGEYELWVIANNIAKDKLMPEKVLHIKKDTTSPILSIVPMPNNDYIYFELSDQFGIKDVKVFINDTVTLYEKVGGQLFYANKLKIDKIMAPITVKWLISDIYDNKVEKRYSIEKEVPYTDNQLTEINESLEDNGRVQQRVSVLQVIVVIIIVIVGVLVLLVIFVKKEIKKTNRK